MTTMRLDRLLANLGYGSRREVQSMVALGQVTLDGEVLSRADQHVLVGPDLIDRMVVNGAPLDPPAPGVPENGWSTPLISSASTSAEYPARSTPNKFHAFRA